MGIPPVLQSSQTMTTLPKPGSLPLMSLCQLCQQMPYLFRTISCIRMGFKKPDSLAQSATVSSPRLTTPKQLAQAAAPIDPSAAAGCAGIPAFESQNSPDRGPLHASMNDLIQLWNA